MNYKQLLERKKRLEKELEATILKIARKTFTEEDIDNLCGVLNNLYNTDAFTEKNIFLTDTNRTELLHRYLDGKISSNFITLALDKDLDSFSKKIYGILRKAQITGDTVKSVELHFNLEEQELIIFDLGKEL